MITNNNELQIFESFEIDHTLPKYIKLQESRINYNIVNGNTVPTWASSSINFVDGENMARSMTIDVRKQLYDQSPTILGWLKLKAYIWSSRMGKVKKPVNV